MNLLQLVKCCLKDYSRSILNSIYPDNWKIAKVLAAFKKGVKSDMANYRPLSMLNLNSKVLESIVNDKVDKHLSKIGSLHPHQWGFKKRPINRDPVTLHDRNMERCPRQRI